MRRALWALVAAATLAAALVAASPASALGPNAVLGDAGCYANAMFRNDDSFVDGVGIGFPIDFFGATYTTLAVNNNGNVTFDGGMSTYTPFPILTTGRKIIAPFFGDVDTRNSASDVTRWGGVTYNGRPALCVTWAGIGVGYYSARVDKLNNFQLLLVDRSDVGPGDFDIVFNYDRIQWETGEASGGSGGLGGNSARAGWSNGTTAAYELAGSAINGGLLDSNATTGLIHNSLNSSQLGRYVFFVRNGVVLPPTNQAPELDDVGPFSVDEGGSVSVTADATDPEGDALTYEWDLDNDGSYETIGQTVSFSAAALDGPSSAPIAVRVSDGSLTDSASSSVDVQNVAPSASLVAPADADVLSAFTLELAGASDAAPADVLSYAFDCGDGSGYGPASSSSTASCPTSVIGTRAVRAKVLDDDGGWSEYTASIDVVDDVAPTGSCQLGANPSGKNKPSENGGFRLVAGADNYSLASIVIADSGSSFVSAPIPSGSTIKLTQDPDGPAADVRPGGGGLLAHITTIGDPILRITDSSGNVTELSCGNLPPK